MLSQAEHDVLASSVLITTDAEQARLVADEIELQTQKLPRREIIEKSVSDFGLILVVKDIDEAVDLANEIAPEHLEVMTESPFELLGKLDNAGSVFLGQYSPEPLGDYYAGPNHVLPTGGTARFFSPLSVDSFVKKTGFISYTKNALIKAADDIITIAEAEGLSAHAGAIRIRKEKGNGNV
jgi:histidinol dehydrogenase